MPRYLQLAYGLPSVLRRTTRTRSTVRSALSDQHLSHNLRRTRTMATTDTSSLVALAQKITRETEKVDAYLKEHAREYPSFDVDGPVNFPPLPEELQKSRLEIVRATKELGDLVVGPTEHIRWLAWDHTNQLSLQAVYHFGIAKVVPLDGTISFADIAKAVNVDEVNVRRLLRHAMVNRIFKEPSPGIVAHTAPSRVLAEDEAMQNWVGFNTEDIQRASVNTIDAMERNPGSQEPTQSGFTVAFNTVDKEPMWVTFGKDPERAKRFGSAMQSLTGGEGYEVQYAIDNYDWKAIDDRKGTFVDVGGSHGFVCIDLANNFKNMKFVVQDTPKMISSAPKPAGDVAERIEFMVHDFHKEQPVKGADVYFFRWIFHNQSDKYALNMLRQLIPAMKKGAKVVINDYCLPEPGENNPWDERLIRSMDLVMLSLLNARERSADEFKTLFSEASHNFRFLGVTRPKGCRMSLVEAVWEGEDFGGAIAAEA